MQSGNLCSSSAKPEPLLSQLILYLTKTVFALFCIKIIAFCLVKASTRNRFIADCERNVICLKFLHCPKSAQSIICCPNWVYFINLHIFDLNYQGLIRWDCLTFILKMLPSRKSQQFCKAGATLTISTILHCSKSTESMNWRRIEFTS